MKPKTSQQPIKSSAATNPHRVGALLNASGYGWRRLLLLKFLRADSFFPLNSQTDDPQLVLVAHRFCGWLLTGRSI